jgi:L-2-hydroxyglutarate oxidase
MRKTVVVIGGGIIGLSTALNILEKHPKVKLTLIEKEKSIAAHQTGHNSGVIHSGLYYKPGSLKALNCLAGYRMMIAFCEQHDIPFEITGKIVVATNISEVVRLGDLHRRGIANGLTGLRSMNSSEIQEVEPHCVGLQGLHVPQTGIVDYSKVAKKIAQLIVDLGGEIILNRKVKSIKRVGGKVEIFSDSERYVSDAAVVCAGLQSDRLAKLSATDKSLRILPFRGEYYEFTKDAPRLVNNLIYPVPDPALPFLGVHFTRGVDGVIECGPNAVFSFGRETYRKSDIAPRDLWDSLTWPGTRKLAFKHWSIGLEEYYRSVSKRAFVRALQKFVPELQAQYLKPGSAGIRAQALDRNGNLLDDFEIRQDANLLHVCNAPSPAATASLAIGDKISRTVLELLV